MLEHVPGADQISPSFEGGLILLWDDPHSGMARPVVLARVAGIETDARALTLVADEPQKVALPATDLEHRAAVNPTLLDELRGQIVHVTGEPWRMVQRVVVSCPVIEQALVEAPIEDVIAGPAVDQSDLPHRLLQGGPPFANRHVIHGWHRWQLEKDEKIVAAADGATATSALHCCRAAFAADHLRTFQLALLRAIMGAYKTPEAGTENLRWGDAVGPRSRYAEPDLAPLALHGKMLRSVTDWRSQLCSSSVASREPHHVSPFPGLVPSTKSVSPELSTSSVSSLLVLFANT